MHRPPAFAPGPRHRAGRITASAAALAATALALAGCAGQGSGSSESADPDAKVTLSFWNGFTEADGTVLQEVIDDFNASQDRITVETNIMPWDTLYQKVLTSVAGSDGPDIIAMDSSKIPQFASQGLFQAIDDFYSDEANDTAALADAAISASEYDGSNYGVPVDYTPTMLYYNKDLLSAAGIDPDSPPETWDDFAAMVPQLTVDANGDGKPEQYAISIGDHETVEVMAQLLWNTGGGIVSDDGKTSILDSDETLQALDFWVDLVREQQASPVGLSGADADKLFQTGKAAMEINGPWMTSSFDEAGLDYGVAPVFSGPDGDATLASVVSMGVSAKADATTKAAAYEFFQYWNSKDAQIAWSSGSGFPPNRADVADQITGNPYPAIFGSSSVAETAQVLLPGVAAGGTILSDIFDPAIQQAFSTDESVESIFQEASAKVQDELDQ